MSARRRKFSECGHFGFGSYCHRCKEGDRLIAASDGFSRSKDKDEVAKAKDLKAEGERLKAPAKKKTAYTVVKVVDPGAGESADHK